MYMCWKETQNECWGVIDVKSNEKEVKIFGSDPTVVNLLSNGNVTIKTYNFFIGDIWIYFYANMRYYISMKGEIIWLNLNN